MENLFRKFVYTGVGFVSLTSERMIKQIEKLVGDGKISESEGQKIVDDFMKNTETKKDELEGQFKSIIETYRQKGLAKRQRYGKENAHRSR